MTNAVLHIGLIRAIRSDLWLKMDAAHAVHLSPWDPDFEITITVDTALEGLFPAYRSIPTSYAEAHNEYLLKVGA